MSYTAYIPVDNVYVKVGDTRLVSVEPVSDLESSQWVQFARLTMTLEAIPFGLHQFQGGDRLAGHQLLYEHKYLSKPIPEWHKHKYPMNISAHQPITSL